MRAVLAFIHQDPIWFAAGVTLAHHVFDAAVDSLPAPQALSSPGYQFLYRFAQKIAGNYRKS
jgi:hypothetical protein